MTQTSQRIGNIVLAGNSTEMVFKEPMSVLKLGATDPQAIAACNYVQLNNTRVHNKNLAVQAKVIQSNISTC